MAMWRECWCSDSASGFAQDRVLSRRRVTRAREHGV